MSRIILTKYDNGEDRVVVGYDRPCASYFWQEFNKEPEKDANGEQDWEGWNEMKRLAGYDLNELPTLRDFMFSVPPDIARLITEPVAELLRAHSMDPDAGRIVVDMTKPSGSFKAEVMVIGESKWGTNALRFATYQEAEAYGEDLFQRWTMCKEFRVAESEDPVNYEWKNGGAVAVKA